MCWNRTIALEPETKLFTDITDVKAGEDKLYLSVVTDLFIKPVFVGQCITGRIVRWCFEPLSRLFGNARVMGLLFCTQILAVSFEAAITSSY